MSLPSTYTQETKKLVEVFGKIRDAQAPSRFTNQLLVDWGYKSKNHRAFVPILKSLKFLTSDGVPTQRYLDYRSHASSKSVMGTAIKETYSDIFLITEKPSEADRVLIEGKFKSYHNTTDLVASLMTKTFYALLGLADLSANTSQTAAATHESPPVNNTEATTTDSPKDSRGLDLHYNIQIHLPETKDVEVYNAIFKSLKEHLLE